MYPDIRELLNVIVTQASVAVTLDSGIDVFTNQACISRTFTTEAFVLRASC